MGGVDAIPDVQALRRCLGDVAALSALSAVWAGAPRSTIAAGLAQVVRDTVDADVVCVGLRATAGAAAAADSCQSGPGHEAACERIRAAVAAWLNDPSTTNATPAFPTGSPQPFVTPIGIAAEHGVIAALVSRDGFPSDTDRLMLNVAANQATVALLTENARDLFAEAQRANMAKDQFLATLSHELRTPLNAIVGWLSMLRRPEIVSTATTPRAWAAIDRNAEALTGLIEDLLDVSRIATGKLRIADEDVDVNTVVRESIRSVEPRVAEKEVRVSTALPPDACLVRGDEARLRQVVVNLLTNAIRFTAAGGLVEARVTCDDTAAVVTITDTGVGIDPDFLPHVFERFRQGDSDATTGLGLGLAIVKNLVELHGGTVAAASDGIGRGARFTVTLPRRREPPIPTAPSGPGSSRRS